MKARVQVNYVGSRASDCLFCNVLRQPPSGLPWHDRPLARMPDVGAVIAGLGAFVPGYVLVFPEQHIESSLQMGARTHQAFSDLLWSTVERVAAIFGPPTVFEHGTCPGGSQRRSACIDHAHMHVIPGSYDLARKASLPRQTAYHGTMPTPRGPRAGYLFLQEPAASPLYTHDPGISQFFRRQIAGVLGEPDDWDYLLFPRWDNVRETVMRFHAGTHEG
jgi:diadenosine tetraphosphate (Ap4A) HIT family hydrolase